LVFSGHNYFGHDQALVGALVFRFQKPADRFKVLWDNYTFAGFDSDCDKAISLVSVHKVSLHIKSSKNQKPNFK
jgi:dolichyl-phosphate-mannose--protein O-mannosyl transferase